MYVRFFCLNQVPKYACTHCIRTFAVLSDWRAHVRDGCHPFEEHSVIFRESLANPDDPDEVQVVRELLQRNEAIRSAAIELEEAAEEEGGDAGDDEGGDAGAGGASTGAGEAASGTGGADEGSSGSDEEGT